MFISRWKLFAAACIYDFTSTYNGAYRRSGRRTFGGYSASIVVDEGFVLRIVKGQLLAETAPLRCAGIALYSPLQRWHAGPGKKVGIIGPGGLGHVGMTIARAMRRA